MGDRCVNSCRQQSTLTSQDLVRYFQVASSPTKMSNNGFVCHYKKITNRIFVGGLPFNTNSDELVEFFSHFAAVRDGKVIYDREGISRGYGFITFYREEDAEAVLNQGVVFYKEKRLKLAEAFRKYRHRPSRQARNHGYAVNQQRCPQGQVYVGLTPQAFYQKQW
ncbi:protein boule-like [Exaiptasia diaphana]|uniref:RRM domain-containing protein n=1 Tax=Exaiptasia diaphana TaxID=2652724 RepID=A0A913WYD6_EXADI|nr:protein boule-like [Exaiptasia diaphana]